MCLRDTIALLSRLQKLWDLVVEHSDFCSTKWEGWILNFISRRCFNNVSSGMLSKFDPFKMSETGKNTKAIYEKFNRSNENMQDIKVIYQNLMASV